MKKILLSIIAIFILSSNIFAGEYYDELCEMIKNNKFQGNIYTPSSSILQFGPTYGDDWTSKTKVTSPKWFKDNNDYYLVLATETEQYVDENDKKLGVYAITEYLEDEIAVVKYNGNYEAYYFNENGICSSAITNTKNNKITFNSDGTVKAGYIKEDVEITDIDLPKYVNDDFDKTKGIFNKETKEALYDGYWILDKENEKYDLYKANSSGSSSTVSGATNKTVSDLYTIIITKKYTVSAIRKTPNSSSNIINTNSSNTSNTNNTTSSEDVLKIKENDLTYKVINGKLQIIPKNNNSSTKISTQKTNNSIPIKLGNKTLYITYNTENLIKNIDKNKSVIIKMGYVEGIQHNLTYSTNSPTKIKAYEFNIEKPNNSKYSVSGGTTTKYFIITPLQEGKATFKLADNNHKCSYEVEFDKDLNIKNLDYNGDEQYFITLSRKEKTNLDLNTLEFLKER